MTDLREILEKVSDMTAELIEDQTTNEGAMAVAAALCRAASVIFKRLCGPRFAAEQFYAMGDRLAAEAVHLPPPG